MKHKHSIWAAIVGWLIALLFPPQRLFAAVKAKA